MLIRPTSAIVTVAALATVLMATPASPMGPTSTGASPVSPDASPDMAINPDYAAQFGPPPLTTATDGISGGVTRESLALTATLPGIGPFRSSDEAIDTSLSPSTLPYALGAPTQLDPAPVVTPALTLMVDAEGIRKVVIKGTTFDHPVAQAQYGLAMLESHRLTGAPAYLDRAEKQADWLINRAVTLDGTLFYPYPFDWKLHGSVSGYSVPWYSGMAQGQVLSLLSRLALLTGRADYAEAANRTFDSLLRPKRIGQPWATAVIAGNLWIEEYPSTVTLAGDRTYNGHVFATFGVYDYLRLTGDARAAVLLRGALQTTRDAYRQIRVSNAPSSYCVEHRSPAGGYHAVHIGQLMSLFAITGNEAFALLAEHLLQDAPPPAVNGTVMIQPGSHTLYRLDSRGLIAGSTAFGNERTTSAPADRRQRIVGKGVFYRLTAGKYSGYFIQETRGRIYMRGQYSELSYPKVRTGITSSSIIRAYTWSGSTFTGAEAAPFTAGTRVSYDTRATLNGVQHVRLVSEPLAGRWISAAAVGP